MGAVWAQWLAVFAALFALDFVWARYTAAITAKEPSWAGGYASTVIVLSGFATVSYVGNPWLLLPAAVGAFCGTYAAVKIGA